MQQYHRSPKYTHSSNPYALGDGLRMGLEAGAYLWGEEFFLPDFGRILADAQYPSPTIAWINTKPEGRTVWEVYVNEEGQRFVREDSSSIHTKERALLDQPQHRFWVILDEFGLSQSTSLVGNWSTQKLHKAFDHKAMFWKAHTLEELAQAAGISPAGLVETISKYNLGCQSGQDLFGRIQLPAPIAKPPFYAICCHGCSIVSCGGIAVNSNLEVLRKEGGIVPGLYAAGEILGKAAFSGQSRCGGMSLTPALTLGRLLGQKIIRIG